MLLLLTATFVISPTLMGTVFSCNSLDPVIDGSIDQAVEWDKGKPIDVKLHNLYDGAESIIIQIQSVYGEDKLIYFAVIIPHEALLDPLDYFFIIFRQGDVPAFIEPPYNKDGNFGEENDLKMMWLHNNHTQDFYTLNTGYTWADDISNSGYDNGYGKCYNNRTHIQIEMQFPMGSGDTAGFDFNLNVNDKIEMFLWFHDETKGIDYCMIRESHNEYYYLVLDLSCTGVAPLPLISILIGLICVPSLTILIRKRKS
ncbi:MAG: hypothetical protein JXA54_02385 [Candidatus Heimdallarchaeota archaeon]|nr:hypothetical protein [Candidatus Heimdallarchaeota archaeon]